MSWILSSINIEAMRFDQYEKWFYKSDRETELLNKKVLIEGDCYYHEHLFINEVISIQDVVDGSYAVAFLHDNYILCTSDSICTRNIYYFQNNDFYCVSSSLRLLINAISNCISLSLD